MVCSCIHMLNDAGVIEKWHKKEGDVIKRDEVICDIRTQVTIHLCQDGTRWYRNLKTQHFLSPPP